MENIILDSLHYNVDDSSIFKRLRVDEGDEEAELIRQLASSARTVARPKAVYKKMYIDEKGDDYVIIGGVTLKSRILRVNLDQVYRVFPYVLTSGTELEEWSESLDDMIESYWADIIKEMILYSSIEHFYNHIRKSFHIEKVSTMNPGSLEDWPLAEQKNLFALIDDPMSSVGVELTESCLMIPVKSVSGIIFPSETGFVNCQLCERNNCPGRKAPYDMNIYQEKYGKA